MSLNTDIKYSNEKLEMSKNFANKIWNASKFVISNLDLKDDFDKFDENKLCIEDKWILSRVNTLTKEVTALIDKYELGVAVQKVYDFMWFEFCDWYIEMVKSRLYDKECNTRLEAEYTLNKVLSDSLKLLHPFAPFITEEIYLNLVNDDESIMISKWPEYTEKYNFEKEVTQIELLQEIIKNVRNIKANMNVPPSKKISAIFVTTDKKDIIEKGNHILSKLINIEEYEVRDNKENIDDSAVSIATDGIEVFIPLGDLVDISQEIERLKEEEKRLISEVERVEKMLSNPGFVSKAPEKKINEEKEKKDKYTQMLENVRERISSLSK